MFCVSVGMGLTEAQFYIILSPLSIIYTMSRTYNPKKKKRANTHGFLRRKKSKTGNQVLLRRRRKGRKKLTV